MRVMAKQARNILHTQQMLDLARTAIALERWWQEHGDYPATLAELVPAYLDAVPPDRFAPKRTIQYQRTPNGRYRLWGVGSDRVDGGGESGERDRNGRDGGDSVWFYAERPPPEEE